MKCSARNQFSGQISAVHPGAVHDEITLMLGDGVKLVAVVTHDSAVQLGLAVGQPAVAMIKASSVLLLTDVAGMRFSARNHFQGQVTRLQAGAVNSEVTLTVPGLGEIVAMVTNDSCHALALQVGQPAAALFKAASVILAVPA